MPLDVEQIPDTETSSVTEPTRALSGLGKASTRRRTVLRGVGLSGLTLGATALSWSPVAGQRAARAENGPNGLRGWDRTDCRDAYPSGYTEQRDTGGAYQNEPAACFGGDFMGSMYCTSGWHKKGTVRDAPITYTYTPISTACGSSSTKNAWKWRVGGRTWRCSDGNTRVSGGGSTRTYLTICRAPV
ncbi:hypothetical protein [Actinoplanes sp. NPDC049118]|uniref:hypothetical protein n=1 Tax=Actinoplanes sp. NPDC049118 TaxID=3155769 RepID=UPI003409ED23